MHINSTRFKSQKMPSSWTMVLNILIFVFPRLSLCSGGTLLCGYCTSLLRLWASLGPELPPVGSWWPPKTWHHSFLALGVRKDLAVACQANSEPPGCFGAPCDGPQLPILPEGLCTLSTNSNYFVSSSFASSNERKMAKKSYHNRLSKILRCAR